MRKVRVETYEQGTGRLLKTEEVDVPDAPEPVSEKDLRNLIEYAKKQGWIT